MGDANVAAIERIFEAFTRREGNVAFEVYDSEIVWDTRSMDRFPDLRGVYHGKDAIRAWWKQWLDAWEAIEWDQAEHEAHGSQVVSSWVQRNRGRASGVEVPMESSVVWTFENGRIVRAAVFGSRAEGRGAAGLPPD